VELIVAACAELNEANISAQMMEEILQRRFVFMVFGSGEFRFRLSSPEPSRKVSGNV